MKLGSNPKNPYGNSNHEWISGWSKIGPQLGIGWPIQTPEVVRGDVSEDKYNSDGYGFSVYLMSNGALLGNPRISFVNILQEIYDSIEGDVLDFMSSKGKTGFMLKKPLGHNTYDVYFASDPGDESEDKTPLYNHIINWTAAVFSR